MLPAIPCDFAPSALPVLSSRSQLLDFLRGTLPTASASLTTRASRSASTTTTSKSSPLPPRSWSMPPLRQLPRSTTSSPRDWSTRNTASALMAACAECTSRMASRDCAGSANSSGADGGGSVRWADPEAVAFGGGFPQRQASSWRNCWHGPHPFGTSDPPPDPGRFNTQ